MSRQNRVDPFGSLVATDARGTLMGNRGCLHDDAGRIVRRYANKAWIACTLQPKFGKRQLMRPGHYTELFFLDEATALAAGHRPCAQCRRADFRRFVAAWRTAHPRSESSYATVQEIDATLHVQRTVSERPSVDAAELPDGAMVRIPGDGRPLLVRRGQLLPWAFEGYGTAIGTAATRGRVELITTPAMVAVLKSGYSLEPQS